MLLTFYVNIDNIVNCIHHKVEATYLFVLTADPLNIVGRGGIREGLSFTGIFMFNCGHQYSVIAYGRFIIEWMAVVSFLINTKLF
jgi:hypothetical protein